MKLSNNHSHDDYPYEKLLKHCTPNGRYPALNLGSGFPRLRHRRDLLARNQPFPRLTSFQVNAQPLRQTTYKKCGNPCLTPCNAQP